MGVKGYFYKLATDRYKGFVPGVLKAILWLLSLVYGLIVRVLAWSGQVRSCRLPCKVISVGNITLGGTGKTSLVEFIAQKLTREGHKVAVVSRGYKRKAPNLMMRLRLALGLGEGEGQKSLAPGYREMGDEPYMLQEKLPGVPVIVDADRMRAARQAVKEFRVDTVILDDAFQQWSLKKDLEVVTFDTADPFGNGHVLPRGILREPLTALRRADIFVMTKANLAKGIPATTECLENINPRALIVEAVHTPVAFYEFNKKVPIALEGFKGERVALVSGIGAPDSFEKVIEGLGLVIGLHVRFPDHHHYQAQDIEKIAVSCRKNHIEVLITTEKDAVRLRAIRDMRCAIRLLVLRIELELTKNAQGFNTRLAGLYSS